MHSLVFIVGPTASGKSALALRAAQEFKGVILNADSVQTYQRLNVGAAKPTAAEQRLVPHKLFDVLRPGEVLTAGDYRKMALQVLEKELAQHPVFAVGGSGFYIQALERGMFEVEKSSPEIEAQVRQDLAERGLPKMYDELKKRDPEYAEKVSSQDTYRILRALVIIRERNISVSELRKQFKPISLPYHTLKMALHCPRDILKRRIELRTSQMLKDGLLDEVKALVIDGYSDWPPLTSVGYWQCLKFLKGELDLNELAPQISEKTMQLAKKQMTWFRRDKSLKWFQYDQTQEALDWIKQGLSSKQN